MLKNFEGALDGCLGVDCPDSCCRFGFGESVEDFSLSLRSAVEESLIKAGLDIEKDRGFIRVTGCSVKGRCVLLHDFNHLGDIRALACKIYPYFILKKSDEIVEIGVHPCPVVKDVSDVPAEFTQLTIRLIKRQFLLNRNKRVDVIISTKGK